MDRIKYIEKWRMFKLDTQHSSYICALVDEPAYLAQIYYGRRISDDDVRSLASIGDWGGVPSSNPRDKLTFTDSYPFEYPVSGCGDFRETALRVRTESGHAACELFYSGHRIEEGKPSLEGLPATFGDNAQTLIITLKDPLIGLEAELYYSVFEDSDALIRSVKLVNGGKDALYLERALSVAFEIRRTDAELLTLNGAWARERHIQRNPVAYGYQGVFSRRGESSHQHNPFIAVLSGDCRQEQGEAYGLSLCYSGNFRAGVFKDPFERIRVMAGIDPEDFCWKLEPGDHFTCPEAALVYSAQGLGGMSRTYHDLYRDHLIRSAWKDRLRPILINNWEATYFDFDSEKLLAIAKEAAKSGIEMLVMDDGWFGNRYDDNRALGDWQVNEEKLKGGLKKLVDGVNALGLKFGIWFEPEMVSPDSELYRAHPDWAIAVPGRKAGLGRNQYVLDLTRPEVSEHVFRCLTEVLDSANIEYVKWDMNRPLSDLGSLELPPERMGEFSHRYMLAVYALQEKLIKRYPELLLENCSGGGGRFDAGMLYYSPQIWCSDDTDAIERLAIQEGTALVYPLSCMGAHVSDCPNHITGRSTPFETRGQVALAGTFGYELDITRIPAEDRARIPGQVELYKKYHMLIAQGDYYRLESYGENGAVDAWMVVSRDKSEALVSFLQVKNVPNKYWMGLKLAGLDPERLYRWEEGEAHGDSLMYAGLMIHYMPGDFRGKLIHLTT
ncbi:MAG: alpha-galactosidase [Lachnospiraceae bacterium]|nr:alpha-galactosidase [Lachnospiraceae bacterium]